MSHILLVVDSSCLLFDVLIVHIHIRRFVIVLSSIVDVFTVKTSKMQKQGKQGNKQTGTGTARFFEKSLHRSFRILWTFLDLQGHFCCDFRTEMAQYGKTSYWDERYTK